MIHFNSISLLDNNSSTTPTTSGSQSGSDFQDQLSAAISATLEQFGVDPSQVNITIGPSANSGSNPPLTGFAAIAAAITPNGTTTPSSGTSTPTNPAASASTTSTTAESSSDADINADLSFDEAYWAKQPAAVQELQNIDDPTERELQAANLAAQGYTIDVPIMAWGWDPSKVTDLRQSFGYSWVPSAMQAPVEQAPGLTGFGQPYNPNTPPTGSIAV